MEDKNSVTYILNDRLNDSHNFEAVKFDFAENVIPIRNFWDCVSIDDYLEANFQR